MKRNYKLQLLTALIAVFAFAQQGVSQTTFDFTGAIETYTVPDGVSMISIQAFGAQGGNDNGGLGAGIYGEFTVTPGQELNIVVGGQGVINNCGGGDASGGGGGGSFVWNPLDDALPWVAAGGGGGGNENWSDLVCRAGVDGQAGEGGTSGANGLADGGIDGEGGAGDAPSGTGSGGGGWLSAGQNSTFSGGSTGGQTLPDFTGGVGSTSFDPGGEGGFGGGGGAVCGCGGGGGYSGGAGGEGSSCRAGGGGGGSFNAGIAQVNETGVRMGNGQIVITVLCSPIELAEEVADSVCFGTEITLEGAGSATYTWDLGVINGEPFTVDTEGLITYTVTSDDALECGTSFDIFVQNEIISAVSTTDEIIGSDGAIDVSVGGGTGEGFTFDWDNDGTGDFDDTEDLTGLVAGTYTLVVMDSIGCTITIEAIVNSQLGIENDQLPELNVYPNPTSQFVTIALNETFVYVLYGTNGQIVLSGQGKEKEQVLLENLPAGNYILEVSTETSSRNISLIKH